MVAPSLSREAESPLLGSFWMDPIKEFHPSEQFTLWFRQESETKTVHFCLSRKAEWTKVNRGFHLSIGEWSHYWIDVGENTELTFEGRLPSRAGKVTLVKVGRDIFRCGQEGVTIEILP